MWEQGHGRENVITATQTGSGGNQRTQTDKNNQHLLGVWPLFAETERQAVRRSLGTSHNGQSVEIVKVSEGCKQASLLIQSNANQAERAVEKLGGFRLTVNLKPDVRWGVGFDAIRGCAAIDSSVRGLNIGERQLPAAVGLLAVG
jgi:hypothetical protein